VVSGVCRERPSLTEDNRGAFCRIGRVAGQTSVSGSQVVRKAMVAGEPEALVRFLGG
jgi:hypothetical protein